jgi:hypothetical protein
VSRREGWNPDEHDVHPKRNRDTIRIVCNTSLFKVVQRSLPKLDTGISGMPASPNGFRATRVRVLAPRSARYEGKKSILNPKLVEVRRNEPQTLNPCRLYPELLNPGLNKTLKQFDQVDQRHVGKNLQKPPT